MNPLDLGVIAVIVLSAVFAFARGFVREALSIAAWAGAAAITLYGFNAVYAMVEPMVHNPLLSQVVAGFGLFVVSLIVLTIVTSFVARMVRASALSPIDRTLGFIFGLVRGAFILALAAILLDVMVPKEEDRPAWIREAKSEPYLHRGADVLRDLSVKFLPDRFVPDPLKVKSAIDETRSAVPAVLEAQRAMRALASPSSPKTSTPDAAPSPPNYPPGDRRDLDRLIGSQR